LGILPNRERVQIITLFLFFDSSIVGLSRHIGLDMMASTKYLGQWLVAEALKEFYALFRGSPPIHSLQMLNINIETNIKRYVHHPIHSISIGRRVNNLKILSNTIQNTINHSIKSMLRLLKQIWISSPGIKILLCTVVWIFKLLFRPFSSFSPNRLFIKMNVFARPATNSQHA
jgi:hypothetical protein